jgi:hypothetical protein
MWEESHGGGVTIYKQKRDGLLAIVQQGSAKWTWRVYDAATRQSLAASKGLAGSPTQADAYQAAEAAMAALVTQRGLGSAYVPLDVRTTQQTPAVMLPAAVWLPPIRTASELDTFLHQEYDRVLHDPEHNLAPYRRLLLYDALGSTAAFATPVERVAQLQAGKLSLTRADRVRARIARQTAHYVLPIWDAEIAHVPYLLPAEIESELRYILDVMIEFDLPPEVRPPLLALLAARPVDYEALYAQVPHIASELPTAQAALLDELIQMSIRLRQADSARCLRLALDPNLLLHRAVAEGTFLAVASTELPQYTLDLAEAMWQGAADPAAVLPHKALISQILGTNLGLADEELPARAFDVVNATYEALNQVLGFGPFDGVQITPDTREWTLLGTDAAAAAAVRAFSGVFDGPYATDTFDPERQRVFWEWWLTEAVPQAWAAEAAYDDSTLDMQPFRETVRVRRVHLGFLPRDPLSYSDPA